MEKELVSDTWVLVGRGDTPSEGAEVGAAAVGPCGPSDTVWG